MLKYIYGLIAALCIMLVAQWINLHDFLSGWFSCVAYETAIRIYDHEQSRWRS